MKTKEQPVIIIRRKKAGHGHHGGAWKVAYADFVTAMMAFFLVMWLAAQDSRIRDAVAGYFQEPGLLPYQTSNSILAQGNGGIDSAGMPVISRKFNGTLEAEQRALMKAAGHIHQGLSELAGSEQLRNQIKYSWTSEGLRIELIDQNGSSFFTSGSAALRGETEKILAIVANEVSELPNEVVVEGHTDSAPYVMTNRYSNWELSSDRAQAARRVLQANGLRPDQVGAVRGFADQDLRLPDQPLDPSNRRVSIVIRYSSAVDLERTVRARQTSPEAIEAVAGGMGPKDPAAAAAAAGAVSPQPATPAPVKPALQPMTSERQAPAH
jgi:chemotaxis protein MotB